MFEFAREGALALAGPDHGGADLTNRLSDGVPHFALLEGRAEALPL